MFAFLYDPPAVEARPSDDHISVGDEVPVVALEQNRNADITIETQRTRDNKTHKWKASMRATQLKQKDEDLGRALQMLNQGAQESVSYKVLGVGSRKLASQEQQQVTANGRVRVVIEKRRQNTRLRNRAVASHREATRLALANFLHGVNPSPLCDPRRCDDVDTKAYGRLGERSHGSKSQAC